jgi:hypothetical protein
MFRKLLQRAPSHTTVVAYLSLFLVLGGGVAYAANTVFSTDIVDGQVKNADLNFSTVTGSKVPTDA